MFPASRPATHSASPHLPGPADNESGLFGGSKTERLSKGCPGKSGTVAGSGGAPGTYLHLTHRGDSLLCGAL